ncbi:methionyl-tRNA formyltransferase [Schaalia sp. ZJ405]|uniref:methionyl-tRNA formyltransferase n=1 Tax=Schaalia sp. ZJ405 TaxID=2709403 RepID=UPI0013EC7C55|nr:methionyl-tRNA formyltransferase [Schaalia sp. ZJ405]QPK82097.1 methionyl-tRNA formyltransferase [Schaalia sp. ZJ405]
MRIIFAGTPEPAVPTLRALIASHHDVVAVVTRPPARSGRGRTLKPSPVALVATEAQIPLIETSTLKDPEIHQRIAAAGPDLGVVVAYGALVPADVLDMPQHGWINLHFSDLPKYRGAAPVQRAILNGEVATASSVFQLETGLDTGPVFSRLPVDIGHMTSGELLDAMAVTGAQQIIEVVDALEEGTACAHAQVIPEDTVVPLAPRLSSADGVISFDEDAAAVDQRIRAVTPNPGAYTTMPNGKRLKLESGEVVEHPDVTGAPGTLHISKREVLVSCGEGAFRLGRVAPEGKGWMDAAAWARGARLDEDARLGHWQGE